MAGLEALLHPSRSPVGFGISIRIGDTTYLLPWYCVGIAVLLLAGIFRAILSRGQR